MRKLCRTTILIDAESQWWASAACSPNLGLGDIFLGGEADCYHPLLPTRPGALTLGELWTWVSVKSSDFHSLMATTPHDKMRLSQ
jgi:hypothetical protein